MQGVGVKPVLWDGVVQKIDKNAAQLKDEIELVVPIIITTLQKFPVIYKKAMGQKINFAIIVDEAHSFQTGEAARKLKKALVDTTVSLEEFAHSHLSCVARSSV